MQKLQSKAKFAWQTIRHKNEDFRFATDVVIHGISHIFALAQRLVLLPLISIGLSLSDYGIWTQISATTTLLLPFLILGLDQAGVRYLPGIRNKKARFGEAFFGMLLIIYFFCGLVFLAAWPGRRLLSQLIFGDVNYVVFIYLLFMLVAGQVSFTYLLNYWRVVRQITHYALIRIALDATLLVGLLVIIVWLKLGIITGIGYWVGLQWTFAVALFFATRKQISFHWPRNLQTVIPYLRFGFPLVLYAAVYWIINFSDRYFIVNYFDLTQVGIYSAAYTLSRIATSAQIPLNFVLLPTLSKLWSQGDKAKVRNYTERTMAFYLATAIPLVVLLGAGAPLFLDLLAGVTIPEGRLVMILVGSAFLFTGLDQFFRNILMLQERTAGLVLILIPIALLNLTLNYWLIPRYGIIGAALATVLSMGLKAIALYLQSWQGFKYSLNWHLIWRVLLSSSMLIFVVWLIPASTIWLLIANIVLGGVLYLFGLIVLRVINIQDVYLYLAKIRRQGLASTVSE